MIRIVLNKLLLTFIITFTYSQSFSTFYVVGYFTNWSSCDPNTIQYQYLTHINYAFAEATNNGVVYSQLHSDTVNLQNLTSIAHQNNVKVLISIGGYGANEFDPIASDQTRRTTFAQTCLQYVNYFNLDGVDVDWEFPTAGQSATNCVLLMKELSDTLHKHGKLVTMAVSTGGSNADAVLSDIFDYVDWLSIMAYDGGTPHSSYTLAASALSYWQNRGLSSDKTILGLPFYGRNGNNVQTYQALVSNDIQAPYNDYSMYNNLQYNYNGIQTIKDKTALASDNGTGVMIWTICMDTHDNTSLLAAINSSAVITKTVLSTIAIKEDFFMIFPNPANQNIYLKSSKEFHLEKISITISDMSGKDIIIIPDFDPSIEDVINIESLREGIYFVKFQAAEKTFIKKLIKK